MDLISYNECPVPTLQGASNLRLKTKTVSCREEAQSSMPEFMMRGAQSCVGDGARLAFQTKVPDPPLACVYIH